MNDKEKREFERLKEQRKRQIERQNKHIRERYDIISFTVEKGRKQAISDKIKEWGYKSMTEYINRLISVDFERMERAEEEKRKERIFEVPKPPEKKPEKVYEKLTDEQIKTIICSENTEKYLTAIGQIELANEYGEENMKKIVEEIRKTE